MTAPDTLRDAMPLCVTLDFRTVTNTRELVEVEVDWSESLCTTAGILHGGVLMALADSAGAACAFMNLPEGAVGTSTRGWATPSRTS